MDKTPQRNALTRAYNRGWLVPEISKREVRASHREWISGQVATAYSLLNGRGDGSGVLNTAISKIWCDMLEVYPQDVIASAFSEWIKNEKWRPTPAEIIARCEARRPRPVAVPQAEIPAKDICCKEASNAIVEAAGFKPKRIERSAEE